MQPSNSYFTKPIRFIVVGLALFIVVVLVYRVHSSSQFRVVSTNPARNSVAIVSPFFKVSFNKPLSARGVSVTSPYPIINSYQVTGKILVINLNTPMVTSHAYWLTIKDISDSAGHKIASKTFSFTPSNIAAQNLPADQQAAILQKQAAHAPSKTNIGFVGMDQLVSYGVTSAQVNALEQDFFYFSPSAKLISVDTGSIVVAPHDPASASTSSSTSFNVSVDSKIYKAAIDYSDLVNIHLVLYNASGSLAYDSNAAPGNQANE